MGKHNQYTGFSSRVHNRKTRRRKLYRRLLLLAVVAVAVLVWLYVSYIGA